MANDVLTRDLAKKRAEAVSDVKYDLDISLKKNSRTYSGSCRISFMLEKAKGESLILDFTGKIKSLSVNGKKPDFTYKDNKIIISEESLDEELNSVQIEYENEFDKTGDGLHYFKDPEDEREYIYSNFEPYNAHRMLPCFDQPDLKAVFALKVSAPREWRIISNSTEKEINEKGDFKTATFNPTKPLSTYILHLSAGDYASFEDSHGDIPLKIFCRESMKKYLRADDVFTFTKQGLDFYMEFFDFHYPFEKYDQLFVPEFNAGAMENAGAITFSEHLITRHNPTKTERSRLANVILHEMVHMWFGDLVTMKWWDDLWLNESFADYFSYLGMVRATEFKDGWQEFCARKAWAYYQDQLVTSHPIAADAADTDIAFSNFDGISYSKGAAVLKQLMFYIGEEEFRLGVQRYFKRYQWKNTSLKDFMHCLEDSSGKSLSKWTDSWIKTKGLNTITPIYKEKDGRIEKFIIQQESLDNIMRPHKAHVALFYDKDGFCKREKEFNVLFESDENTVKELEGVEKPSFICINSDDCAYMKEEMEDNSLQYCLKSLDRIKEDLTRQMALETTWRMVRDAKIDPKVYLDLVLQHSPKEKNLIILERVFLHSARTMNEYVSDENYHRYCNKFYEMGWKNIDSVPKPNKNAWFSMILTASTGADDMGRLIEMLEGKFEVKDFEFNQEQRWAIVMRMAAKGHQRFDELFESEKMRDPSDKGKKKAFTAEVSKMENKQKSWELFLHAEEHSLDYLRAGMGGFYWRPQKERLSQYSYLFFDSVKHVFMNKDRRYAESFFGSLFPYLFVSEEMLANGEDFIEKHQDMPYLLKKHMLEALDEMSRSLNILEKYEGKKQMAANGSLKK